MSETAIRAMPAMPSAPTVPFGQQQRRRLGEVLVRSGAITEEDLQQALSRQTGEGHKRRLGTLLVELGLVTEQRIATALAAQLGLACVDDDALAATSAAGLVPAALAERHHVLPLHVDAGVLTVATADPTNVVALDDVRLAAGVRSLRVVIATSSAMDRALARAYGFDRQAVQLIEAIDSASEVREADEPEISPEDGPVVRLAESILNEAINARVSDVHIDPGSRETVVRYRIDGVLRAVTTIPRAKAGALVSRLKLIASMDIAERRRPQDGRVAFRSHGQEVDLRVSSLPSLHGETLVLRLLRKGNDRLGLDDIGFSAEQRNLALSAIERPQGLVLITGPTGSGKTSSLYGFLGHLVSETTKVITVEDPVEYELAGVSQTQVNTKVGLTFERALRTVLRQDPDVIMVGEIRDAETAELAIQAAQTGHLVFSTLHTNDAVGAIGRLRDLGVPSYLIASALTMVIAQRLARQICEGCGERTDPAADTLAQLRLRPADLAGVTLRAGLGCERCNGSGYHGRTALFELLPVDASIRELIAASSGEQAVRSAGRPLGLRSLREDGLAKAAAGITTLEEVLRVAPSDIGDDSTCTVCAQHVEREFAVCPWCGTSLHPDRCRSCQRDLEQGWSHCPGCATPVTDEAVPPPASGGAPR